MLISKLMARKDAVCDSRINPVENNLSRWASHVFGLVAICLLSGGIGFSNAQSTNNTFLVNKKFVNQTGVPNTQVNSLAPNQTAYLEFNLFSAQAPANGNLLVNFIDNMPPGLLVDTSFAPLMTDGAGVVGGSGCSAGSGSITTTATSVTVTNVTLPNPSSTGPDCRVVIRVKPDPAAIPSTQSNVTNSVPSSQTSATGVGGPYQSDPFSATVLVYQPTEPTVSKSFQFPNIGEGAGSQLTITIRNNSTTYPLTGVNLTDALPVGLLPLASPIPTAVGCGSGAIAISGQNVSLSNGTVAVGELVLSRSPCRAVLQVPIPIPFRQTDLSLLRG